MEPREARGCGDVFERDVVGEARMHEIDGPAQPASELRTLRPASAIQFRGEQGLPLAMCGDEPFEQELALLLEPVLVAHAGGDLALDESQYRGDLRVVMPQRLIEFEGGFHRERPVRK